MQEKQRGATEEYARLTLLPSGSSAKRFDPKVLPVSSSRGWVSFFRRFPSRVFRGLAVQDAAIRILRYPLHAPPTPSFYCPDPQTRLTGGSVGTCQNITDFSMTLGGPYFSSH